MGRPGQYELIVLGAVLIVPFHRGSDRITPLWPPWGGGVGLTVKDGALTSARDTCTLSTSNSRPVAEAGPDQTVELGPMDPEDIRALLRETR